MDGNLELAMALKKSIAEMGKRIQVELGELGTTHREYIAAKRCPCGVPGSKDPCFISDLLERGAAELAGQPMPTATGSHFN